MPWPLDLYFPSDFILRSSDGVDFHVHREASGDPNQLERDGKSILVLPEYNTVLHKLRIRRRP
ncbi:hypothetical protein C8R44DRAFT_787594 [Mycena epipterygia]|nr:hypothetical protein C8R44DRAFT_787594 [Mycena epipterygia]